LSQPILPVALYELHGGGHVRTVKSADAFAAIFRREVDSIGCTVVLTPMLLGAIIKAITMNGALAQSVMT
jgi:hypothetical protein